MHEFQRIRRLPAYVFNITGELKAAARSRGEDIIDFGMGNPDGATPQHIVDKMIEAARRPETHRYSLSKGIPRLRRAITKWYATRYGIELDPDTEAIVTIGSKEGIAHLCLATLDQGDVVMVPNPSYPIHIYGPVIAGANIRSVAIHNADHFLAELEQAIPLMYPRPKMLILNFPANPTTQCVDLSFFERVVALCRQHEIWLVHDLAYADIVFDGYCAPSVLEVPGAREIAVEFFTLSKSYNMPGWRIGFMVGNPELVGALARLKSYFDYGTFTPLQVAAIVALEGPQECVAEIRDNYQSRRDALVSGLNKAGWEVASPKATMFVWAPIPEPWRHLGSLEFSTRLLQEAKVAVSPGIGFGEYGDFSVRESPRQRQLGKNREVSGCFVHSGQGYRARCRDSVQRGLRAWHRGGWLVHRFRDEFRCTKAFDRGHDPHATAPRPYLCRTDNCVGVVVATLHNHVRLQFGDEPEGRGLIEHNDGVDGRQCRENAPSLAFADNGARRALQVANRFVAVNGDDQLVALPPRVFQKRDMSDVKQIEAAVGEDDALTRGTPRSDPYLQGFQPEDLLLGCKLNFRREVGEEFVAADGHGSNFADHNAGSDIGKLYRRFDLELTGDGQRQRCNDGVAGAGDIEDLPRHGGGDPPRSLLQHRNSFLAQGGGQIA
jgi:alanine-synthesizing transaminase